jgi:hypothetical protein
MRQTRANRPATWMMVALLALASASEGAEVSGKIPGRILAAGVNRVVILNPDGSVFWEHPAKLVHDVWMLASGNVLFADGESVTEVTPDHRAVFQYRSAEQRGGGAFACQRLENGRTLIGENSTGRILEVDPSGKILFGLETDKSERGAHHNMRMVRKLENGNYLVCHSGANLVREYAPDGEVIWQVTTPKLAFAAIRKPDGCTLVSTLDNIFEYDPSGSVMWQFANTVLPGVTITNITGMHLLPSGRLAAGCYRAYQDRAGTGLFAITRDRKLVWRYANPDGDSSMMAIQVLDPDGKPLPGRCLR